MLTLYLVRHGQTEGSREGRFCGAIDVPLNQTGLAMAEALADFYGREPWAAIYASPRQRAVATAAPLARRLGLEVQVEPGIAEIEYGEWEGLLEQEVRTGDGERYRAWSARPGDVAPPGGESGQAIAARAMAVVSAIRARHADGQVLAVSHKATIRVLVCALVGLDLNLFRARIAQPVGSVNVIDFAAAGPLLRKLGDNCHLPAALRREEGT
jgi:probable phosphoglycerate mutase